MEKITRYVSNLAKKAVATYVTYDCASWISIVFVEHKHFFCFRITVVVKMIREDESDYWLIGDCDHKDT